MFSACDIGLKGTTLVTTMENLTPTKEWIVILVLALHKKDENYYSLEVYDTDIDD